MRAPDYDGRVTRAHGLLCAVLALTLALVGISPARADEVPAGTVALGTVTPEKLDPSGDDVVTVAGTFVNTSSVPLYWVSAEFWHFAGTTDSFAALDAAIDVSTDPSTGVLHDGAAVLTRETPIAPGASAAFRVQAPASSLQAAPDELATLVGVQIRAAASATGARATVGHARALLPHRETPVQVSNVQVLPTPTGDDGSPDLAQLADGVTAAMDAGRLVALDQATLGTAQARATAETPDEDAARLVDLTDQLAERRRLLRLPPGNPVLGRLPEPLLADVAPWSDALAGDELARVPLLALTTERTSPQTGFDVTLSGAEAPERLYRVTGEARPTFLDDPRATDAPEPPSVPAGASWPEVDRAVLRMLDGAAIREELAGTDDEPAPDARSVALAAYGAHLDTQREGLDRLQASPVATFSPSAIEFSAASSFVMGERTSEFPTTITNRSGLPVHVRVVFRSDNPLRLAVPDSELVTVAPGEAMTLRVSPEAAANGITTVHAQLQGREGTRLGAPVDIEITATEFGRVGWLIIIVSGIVVLGGTVWRIRTVQRERAKESSESGQ